MRIVHLSHFDPAATGWNLTEAIRGHSPLHESYSVAVQATQSGKHRDASPLDEPERVAALCEAADVLVFHCGTWDWSEKHQGMDAGFFEIDTHECDAYKRWADPAKGVIWLDGSVAVRSHVEKWRERYRGWRICATNPDVAALYRGEWLPACVRRDVDVGAFQVTRHIREQRVLRHPYTDMYLKGADKVVRAVSGMRPTWDFRPIASLPHDACLREMQDADAIVDHFQGYFGVVAMEATAMGLPVVLKLSPLTLDAMARYGWPVPGNWLHVENEGALRPRLEALLATPESGLDEYRAAALGWHERCGRNADKAARFIEWLARN